MTISRFNTSFVQVFPDALPEELCSQLVLLFEAAPKNHVVLEGFRDYYECALNTLAEGITQTVTTAMRRHINEYQRRCCIHPGDWPTQVGFEKFRIRRYDENTGKYGRHVDVGDHASARRFLAFFFYLNDVAEGGETVFFGNDDAEEMVIKPKRGTLVMFPPLWTLPHAGKTPISGPKYMVGSYLHYQ